ncbi:MAG: redoxin family protein [Chitinophagaceae bacterium]
MKLLVSALLLLSGISFLHAQDAITPGTPMPKGDLKVKDVSGILISLNEVKTSGGILVMFSSNTCAYVIRNQQRTRDICLYALEKGIGVVLLNSNDGNRSGGDSFAQMQQYAKSQNFVWKYALDSHSELADALGATRTPECFLFDGNLRLVYHGAIDDNPTNESQVKRKHLKQAIAELVAGKEVSVRESQFIGCTIHRPR